MAKWFKRTKIGSTTYTTYLDGTKPTTWSQSYKDGSTRTTYTNRGGKVTVTKTTKQGSYTNIEKRVANKKQKQIKYKAWKPRHRVKWQKPIRAKRIKVRKTNVDLSFKFILFFILFSFFPLLINLIVSVFN